MINFFERHFRKLILISTSAIKFLLYLQKCLLKLGYYEIRFYTAKLGLRQKNESAMIYIHLWGTYC